MTQQAYEALLAQLAQELNMEKIETNSSGGFVLELDKARWISVAYSAAEDKLMCQLCLEPPPQPLDADNLHYLLRQNNIGPGEQTQHFSLIQAEQAGEEDVIVLLLRLPIRELSPATFLQAIERMLSKGRGVEACLLQTKKPEPDSLSARQMALRA